MRYRLEIQKAALGAWELVAELKNFNDARLLAVQLVNMKLVHAAQIVTVAFSVNQREQCVHPHFITMTSLQDVMTDQEIVELKDRVEVLKNDITKFDNSAPPIATGRTIMRFEGHPFGWDDRRVDWKDEKHYEDPN